MWCGTCHDPHNEPIDPVSYYRDKCLQCHANSAFAPNHPQKTSNCIGCHMPTRGAKDGGHTTFTDHRIQVISGNEPAEISFRGNEDSLIVPWRESSPNLAKRNLGIASINIGMEENSFTQVESGYQMLTEVQQEFSQDYEMYYAMGTALYLEKRYGAAVGAFEQAVRFDPISSRKEASLGQVYATLGNQKQAEQHLEKAMEMDSMNLTAAALLISVYERNGELAKAKELSQKIAHLARITSLNK
jgi:tetratricopeptide (TPR) repeat protein